MPAAPFTQLSLVNKLNVRMIWRQVAVIALLVWQAGVAARTIVPQNADALRHLFDQIRHPSIFAPYAPDLFFAQAARVIPSDSDAVFLQAADRANIWFYFNMSYHLYPRRVVWATPLPRSSDVDWHVQVVPKTSDLARLLRKNHARYLIVDGISFSDLELPLNAQVTWYQQQDNRYFVTINDLESLDK